MAKRRGGKRLIGVSYFGSEQDRRDKKPWRRPRPSVAMATQEALPFDTFILLTPPERPESAVEALKRDVLETWELRGRRAVFERREIGVSETTVYDFDKTLTALHAALSAISEEELERGARGPDDAVIHLSCGSGSHAMQLAYFFLGNWQPFKHRLVLVQPAPADRIPENRDDPGYRKGVSWGAKLNTVSLRYQDYHASTRIVMDDAESRAQALFPTPTKNAAFLRTRMDIHRFGVELSDANILFRGESGTGKTMLASRVHEEWKIRHNRGNSPFIAENCANLSEAFAQSVLFGHVKGAFTGSAGARKGCLELANGGTLFLDEIGDLEPRVQAQLLTAIESKKFKPFGGDGEIESDFRLISGTNRPLEEAIEKKLFRWDFFMRINEQTFRLPPIRELPEDMETLLDHSLELWKTRRGQDGGGGVRLTDGARRIFLRLAEGYRWPGNHREFQQLVVQLARRRSVREIPGFGEISEADVREAFEARAPGADPGEASAETPERRGAAARDVDAMIAEARRRFPGRPLPQAVEILLLEWAAERAMEETEKGGRVMASAARLLYGQSRNDSDKFRKTCRRLDVSPEEIVRAAARREKTRPPRGKTVDRGRRTSGGA